MNFLEVSWDQFRDFVDARYLNIQYVKIGDTYYMKALDEYFGLECKLSEANSDHAAAITEFEDDYKPDSNKIARQTDADEAQIVRLKAAKKGWSYAAIPMEFKTAEIDSLIARTVNGEDRPGITLKFYDADDEEITEEGLLEINETDIIKTVIDFEPAYDYEVIGGQLRIEQDISSAQDCRLWIIAVPDIPAESGGSKEMAGGVNLRFLAPQNAFDIDGRVAKFLQYNATYHTNKLRFIFVHTAGMKVWIHMTVELYKQ